jgi:hypothetical protein
MQYSFKSIAPHNYRSIIIRHLPRFVWPVVIYGAWGYFFKTSAFTQHNLHIYFLLFAELVTLYLALMDDSINEIIVDTANKKLWFNYYTLYQGQIEERYSFDIIKLDIEVDRSGATKQIEFLMKKRLGFTLSKTKDNFTQAAINELSDLLHSITSSKNP